jgi:hypothetical protein
MNKDFFFCYSKELHNHIQRHNINYVCAAYHETTYRKFWLYIRTEQLANALKQYKQLNKSNQ